MENINLSNAEPFKPMTGVKIESFLTRMTFGAAIPGGPILPMGVDVRVEGRALFAIKFDETESYRYQDYKYVGSD